MNLKTYPYREVYREYNEHKVIPGMLLDEGDLYRLVDLFAKVEPVWNMFKEGDQIVDFDQTIAQCDPHIRDAIAYLHWMPRSKFVPTMTKNPTLATLTPLFLYAQLQEGKIPYSAWYGEKLPFAFSAPVAKSIAYACNFSREEVTKQIGEIGAAREHALTNKSGKNAGKMLPLTAYKCSKLGTIDSNVVRSILQLWLFNAAVRIPGTMVLDFWDLDFVPDALDDAVKYDNTRIKEVSWDL